MQAKVLLMMQMLRKYIRGCIPFLAIMILWSATCFAQGDYYGTLGNSRSRALAMGGAFISVGDNFGAMAYNPGAFSLFSDRSRIRVTAAFNPVLPVTRYREQEKFNEDDEKDINSLLAALGYSLKSLGISYKMLDIGILLNEEKFLSKSRGRVFDAEGFTDNYFHTAVASLKLSSQVSLGLSGSFIRNSQDGVVEEGYGFSYGILVRPSFYYQIGITYIDYQDRIKDYRKRFERFADESLNIGISLMPAEKIRFCVDIRNLTESDKPDNFGLQEFHFGFETTAIPHFALRGGYYREKNGGRASHVYSCGIGLIDLNRLRPRDRKLDHESHMLSYALLFENTPGGHYRWHMLTFGIGF